MTTKNQVEKVPHPVESSEEDEEYSSSGEEEADEEDDGISSSSETELILQVCLFIYSFFIPITLEFIRCNLTLIPLF